VPASFIQSFSEGNSRALAVSTVSAADSHTTIRVGNSGIGAAFAQLQQGCERPAVHAVNASAATGGMR
jgi:hypothetical protein